MIVTALARVLVATVAAAGVTALSACSADSAAQSMPETNPAMAAGRSLVPVLTGTFAYQLPVRAGDAISDGAMLVRNGSRTPVRLVRVEPLFAGGSIPDNVHVLGTTVVAVSPGGASGGTGPGISRGLTPPGPGAPASGFIVPAAGTDERRYALTVGLSVDSSRAHVVGLRVTYLSGGRAYMQTLAQDLTVCVNQVAGATACPET